MTQKKFDVGSFFRPFPLFIFCHHFVRCVLQYRCLTAVRDSAKGIPILRWNKLKLRSILHPQTRYRGNEELRTDAHTFNEWKHMRQACTAHTQDEYEF